MANSSTGKRLHQELIIQALRREAVLTRQEISHRLGISMPTTLQCTNALLEKKIIVECGTQISTGGRKPRELCLNSRTGFSIGIDIALHHVEIVLTDFLSNILHHTKLNIPFQDSVIWYKALEEGLSDFLHEYHIDRKQIICAGISFPGIIDEENDIIVRSHIFQLEHVSLDRFHKAIPFPMTVSNDANCASYSEISSEHPRYLYLSLNESVGGGLIYQGKIFKGTTMQAGEFGHIILHPGGRQCYCGKKGCVDPYLSPLALRKKGQTMEDFFGLVEQGDETAREKWDAYLEDLAILTTNLHMALNEIIIIGGETGNYIEPYMEILRQKAGKYDLFARDVDYLFPTVRKNFAFSLGASMLALQKYENLVLEKAP